MEEFKQIKPNSDVCLFGFPKNGPSLDSIIKVKRPVSNIIVKDRKMPDGSVYSGEGYTKIYKKEKYFIPNGKGTAILPTGDFLIGQWNDGSIYGICGFTKKNVFEYYGQIFKGNMHGHGKIYFPNNKIISMEGTWINNVLGGTVFILYEDGSKYVGPIENYERYGEGTFYGHDGGTIRGNWLGDLLDGDAQINIDNTNITCKWSKGILLGECKIKYADGLIYVGSCDKKFCSDGFGKMIYTNGSTHEGLWFKGEKNGSGVLTYTDGSTYTGTWSNDLMHGQFEIIIYSSHDPTVTSPSKGKKFDKTKITCTWSEGKIVDKCKIEYVTGSIYIGTCNDKFCPNGMGTMTYGNTDSGFFKNDDFANRSGEIMYEGNWLFGKRHGPGKLIYYDGVICKGIWVNDVCEGALEITVDYGTIFCEQVSDKMINSCVIAYNDGHVYKGNCNNKFCPNGFGTMTYADGSKYKGSWLNGLKHGYGKMSHSDNPILSTKHKIKPGDAKLITEWSHGIIISLKIEYENGSVYQGSCDEKLRPHGYGVMKYHDRSIYYGYWANGLRHGHGLHSLSNGDYYSGYWFNDKKHYEGASYSKCGSHAIWHEWDNGIRQQMIGSYYY